MEVIERIHVSYEDFEKFLTHMIQRDIYEASQEHVEEIIEGYRYEKPIRNHMQKDEQVQVCIEQFKDGIYEASFETSQGKNTMLYAYQKIDEQEIEVRYEEGYVAQTTSIDMSHKFFSFVSSRGNKKRMKEQLHQIESIILAQDNHEGA